MDWQLVARHITVKSTDIFCSVHGCQLSYRKLYGFFIVHPVSKRMDSDCGWHVHKVITEICQLCIRMMLSPRTTKLWRGYRVCPVRMYVSTYVRTYVRSLVCSPALATSFIIQFRYNFTQVLFMTIPRTS